MKDRFCEQAKSPKRSNKGIDIDDWLYALDAVLLLGRPCIVSYAIYTSRLWAYKHRLQDRAIPKEQVAGWLVHASLSEIFTGSVDYD